MKRIFLALCFAAAASAQPLRVLILTGTTDLPYHDWRITAPFLRDLLERTGRFEAKVTEEPRGITPAALAGYDALVLHYNGPRWGEGPERAVADFVASGKGFISVHGVSYGEFFGMVKVNNKWTASPTGDKGWKEYAGLIGPRGSPRTSVTRSGRFFPSSGPTASTPSPWGSPGNSSPTTNCITKWI